MKQVLAFGAAAVAFLFSGCAEKPVCLLEGGRCSHKIVLEPQASPSERTAAEELQSHFEACTGVVLPILEERPADGSPMIVLGRGPVAESLGVRPDAKLLGEQGCLLKTVSPHVVFAGTAAAGTLYGVHRFLEDYLGVRWFAPDVTKTPRSTDIVIQPTERLIKPAFYWRHTNRAWPGKDAAFMARVGDNNGTGGPDHPYGIQHQRDGGAHSFFRFVSPKEFFDKHPEYFSEIGGVRVSEETQLCLTNPEVLDIVAERMIKRMKEQPGYRVYIFSQMDYYNYCQCAKCRALYEKYGTTGAAQFEFANKLAERTSKVFPDKLVGTLAYMYTEEPPKGMKMHPNVLIWLCHMFPSCDSHPIATCPHDADYKRRLLEWAKICDHIYVWHYYIDFAHLYNPFPNLWAMSADMKFYRDVGVEGVYLQAIGGSPGGEFDHLRPWYGMKLLWDPDQDRDALIKDFLRGYYGAAWKPIWDYIVMLHEKVTKENIHMHLYSNPAQGYLTDDVLRRANALFDEAEKLVKDDEVLIERVKICRMPLTYAALFPRDGYKIRKGRLEWQNKVPPLSELMEFLDRMKRHGFKVIREQGGKPEHLLAMYGFLSTKPKVQSIRNEHLWVDVVPVLAGRALRIVHIKTKKSVTAYNVTRCLFFPLCGGLEDRVGELYRFYGWVEPATVVSKTDNSITTTAQTMNGFILKRTLTLLPVKPVLHVESTLTNPGDKPKEARLRSHMELNLGELRSTKISFTNLAGKWVEPDIANIIDGMREGEHYYDQEAPKGSWTLTGSKGLRLKQSFDNDVIEFTWLYAYPESLGQLELELWARRKTLAPGQSVSIVQDIEVTPAGGASH